MIVPALHRPRILSSIPALRGAGALPHTTKLAALERIARARPDLAQAVVQGQELTLIDPNGDEFTISRSDGDGASE